MTTTCRQSCELSTTTTAADPTDCIHSKASVTKTIWPKIEFFVAFIRRPGSTRSVENGCRPSLRLAANTTKHSTGNKHTCELLPFKCGSVVTQSKMADVTFLLTEHLGENGGSDFSWGNFWMCTCIFCRKISGGSLFPSFGGLSVLGSSGLCFWGPYFQDTRKSS